MLTLQIMDGCYNLIRNNKTGLNGTTERASLRIKDRAPNSWDQAPMGLTASRKREFKAPRLLSRHTPSVVPDQIVPSIHAQRCLVVGIHTSRRD